MIRTPPPIGTCADHIAATSRRIAATIHGTATDQALRRAEQDALDISRSADRLATLIAVERARGRQSPLTHDDIEAALAERKLEAQP